MTNIYTCTPRQVRKHVTRCFHAGVVPMVHGSPGIGKSAVMHAIANSLNLELVDIRLSMADPTDLSGLPVFTNGRATFMPFDMFPLEDTPIPNGKAGWLIFFDEFNSAPKSVQAASYKVVLDRMIGMNKLHPNVVMACAGNLATDRAIVNPLNTAMQSRLVHLEMVADFDEWVQDVAIPQNMDSRIVAYLSQYPSKLMDFRPDHQDKTFCAPRTWEFINRLIQGEEVVDIDTPLYAGTITSGVATEFVQFTKVFNSLVTVQQIIADPNNCPIPQDISAQWATIARMNELVTEENLQPLMTYIGRFSMQFRVLALRTILFKKPTWRKHEAIRDQAVKLSKYLWSE